MKKQLIILTTILLIALSSPLFAQGTAINSTGTEADASAILDVSSTSQGMLIPRMTAVQRKAISSPATGLILFQTDGTAGLYFFNGSFWINLNGTVIYEVPDVTTNNITSEFVTAWLEYTFGGEVTSDNGFAINERGVVYSLSDDPEVDGADVIKVTIGSGTGSYSETQRGDIILNNLTGSPFGFATVYFRAYAINSQGTSYGSTISKNVNGS